MPMRQDDCYRHRTGAHVFRRDFQDFFSISRGTCIHQYPFAGVTNDVSVGYSHRNSDDILRYKRGFAHDPPQLSSDAAWEMSVVVINNEFQQLEALALLEAVR